MCSFLVAGPAQPRSGETAWPGRSKSLFSPHSSPGAGVKTSRLNPWRTRKVFAPASVLDPTSVTWFLQFQRLTKKHVATMNPHGQAGPGKLFWSHFSPGSDVKTSRLMARPIQESHFRLTFRLVPMSKRRVWIHYELVRFLVQSLLWKPWFLAQCFLRLQHTPGPAQPRSGETAWPGRSKGAIFASLFARCRCQNVTAESIKN